MQIPGTSKDCQKDEKQDKGDNSEEPIGERNLWSMSEGDKLLQTCRHKRIGEGDR